MRSEEGNWPYPRSHRCAGAAKGDPSLPPPPHTEVQGLVQNPLTGGNSCPDDGRGTLSPDLSSLSPAPGLQVPGSLPLPRGGVGLAANFITVKVRSQYPCTFKNISVSKILNSNYTCMLKYLGRNALMPEIYFELHQKIRWIDG